MCRCECDRVALFFWWGFVRDVHAALMRRSEIVGSIQAALIACSQTKSIACLSLYLINISVQVEVLDMRLILLITLYLRLVLTQKVWDEYDTWHMDKTSWNFSWMVISSLCQQFHFGWFTIMNVLGKFSKFVKANFTILRSWYND